MANNPILASLLPNGMQQFFDANGKPLAAGSVAFYIPSTTTPKATWQDPAQTISNTNPVTLDAAGRAIIYGTGQYRQVVFDSNGNLIWDQLTNDTLGQSGGFGTLVTIGAATTTDLGTAGTNNVLINGIATINSFGNSASLTRPIYLIQFNNTSTLVQSSALLTPTGININTGTGDVALVQFLGSGNWQILMYWLANGGVLTTTAQFGTQTALASASTTDLGSVSSHNALVTGTTTITSLGNSALITNPIYITQFGGILTLTNGAALALPGNANITTAAGDTAIWQYLGTGNWRCAVYQTASGLPVVNNVPSGTLIQVDTFTSHGTFTWNRPAGCNSVIVECVGPGGGGASSNATAGNHSNGGGGGGSGGYSKGKLTSPAATVTVTIGQAGAGGASGGLNSGGNGSGASSFGTLIVCAAGNGGAPGADVTTTNRGAGGTGGAVSTPGNILTIVGQAGGDGSGGNDIGGTGGAGGSNLLGSGGAMTNSGSSQGIAGLNGTGNGTGGSGASANDSGSSGTAAGGSGADGAVVVWSYT